MEISSLAKWTILFCLVGILGVTYVSMKNRLHYYGEEHRQLEKELKTLEDRNAAIRANIIRLGSREAIQSHLDSGFISLMPIPDERIVRLPMAPEFSPSDELRAVSNEMGF